MEDPSAPPKVCSMCGQAKALEAFVKSNKTKDGYQTYCKACHLAYQRTPDGFLKKRYLMMKRRVEGKAKPETRHIYEGLPLLARNDFLAWSKSNADFWRLYRLWVKSGFNTKLSPSINRIDPDEGYVLGNIEWLTHSLNSGLARHSQDAMFQRIYSDVAA